MLLENFTTFLRSIECESLSSENIESFKPNGDSPLVTVSVSHMGCRVLQFWIRWFNYHGFTKVEMLTCGSGMGRYTFNKSDKYPSGYIKSVTPVNNFIAKEYIRFNNG